MTMMPVASAATPAAPPATTTSSASRYGFGDDGFTFGDFLDIINPLQHIPVIGTIYRAITGDTMEAGAEIAGGALYGGPIGALLSVADVAFAADTGKPIDRAMLSWIGLDGDDAPSAVANNAPTTVAAAAPAIPSRAFPVATTRIVPLANYYAQPAPASPPAASATHAIAPMLPQAEASSAPTAASSPPATTTASAAPIATLDGAQALLAALRDSGVDPASAARAAAAYQASVSPIVRGPVPAVDSAN